MKKLMFVPIVLLFAAVCWSEETSCPHHSEHQKQVNERGNRVMGFDYEKTTHHFQLKSDGGLIIAYAKDEKDTESIEQIRKHFVEIAADFSRGDFSKPEMIHGKIPPGVPELIVLGAKIQYLPTDTPKGGEIRIKASDADALKAIHSFLRFQIEDHQTGDSFELQ